MSAVAATPPLAGVLVLDVSQGVGGAFASRLLADLGARVVKVEPPGGELLRHLGPFASDGVVDIERGGLHLALNAGKESLALDLNASPDRHAFSELLGRADILLESAPPGWMAERGLDYAALEAQHPHLVYGSLTPFGQDGPYARRVSSEIVDAAMGGQMYLCGDPERTPLFTPGHQGELHGGMHLALGVSIALWHARRTGAGQHVDVSRFESRVNANVFLISSWLQEGEVLRRQGPGLTPCADGFLVWGRPSPEIFYLIEQPDLVDDPRFATMERWRSELPAVHRMLEEWARNRTRAEIVERAQMLRIHITPVNTVADLAASHQLAARGWWLDLEHSRAGKVTVPGPPWRLSGGDSGPRSAAPVLGEHGPLPERRSVEREPAAAADRDSQPLAGLRVVEVTHAWAGPLAARHLADMGADVIRVERSRIDTTRGHHFAGGPSQVWPRFYNRAGGFNLFNRNKRSVVLDLQHEAGREAFVRLAHWADVLIENNAPRVFPNLGLSYEELARENPQLVMCSISAFGATGPEASHTGIGPNVEGSSGWVAQTGYGAGDLAATGALQPDPIGGTIAPTVILAALLQRERTGYGQHIDLSLQECASSFVVESIMDLRLSGRIAGPLNNRSRRFAPQGVYPSAGDDCWLALAVEGEDQWRALCATIERSDLAAAHSDLDARHAAHDEIDEAIASWSRARDHNEATRRLQEAGIPAGPVLANWELASDPHLYERGYWVETVHPEVGYERWEGYPWRLSRTPGRARRAAPRYAEHNDEVLREVCGLTANEIEGLRRSGALMDEPGDTHLFALASASPAAMSSTGNR